MYNAYTEQQCNRPRAAAILSGAKTIQTGTATETETASAPSAAATVYVAAIATAVRSAKSFSVPSGKVAAIV